jgi:hypothetical protein
MYTNKSDRLERVWRFYKIKKAWKTYGDSNILLPGKCGQNCQILGFS